jgi:hypothetical protein
MARNRKTMAPVEGAVAVMETTIQPEVQIHEGAVHSLEE